VIAHPPARCIAAHRFNAAMGMSLEGRIPNAYLKHGALDDLLVYGVTRDAWQERHGDQFPDSPAA
jgi:RimJ/RimL family protein N-acetyltransferase